MHSGRKRPGSNRSMTAREAAHRLWGTPLDPEDDPEPPDKTPNQRMNELLLAGLHRKKPQP